MKRIKRIELRALALVGAAALFSLVFIRDGEVSLGLAVGGAIELINFHVLAWIVDRILRGVSPIKAVLLTMALAGKFSVLGLSIYLAINTLPVKAVALIVGITLVVAAMLLEALYPEGLRFLRRR